MTRRLPLSVIPHCFSQPCIIWLQQTSATSDLLNKVRVQWVFFWGGAGGQLLAFYFFSNLQKVCVCFVLFCSEGGCFHSVSRTLQGSDTGVGWCCLQYYVAFTPFFEGVTGLSSIRTHFCPLVPIEIALKASVEQVVSFINFSFWN